MVSFRVDEAIVSVLKRVKKGVNKRRTEPTNSRCPFYRAVWGRLVEVSVKRQSINQSINNLYLRVYVFSLKRLIGDTVDCIPYFVHSLVPGTGGSQLQAKLNKPSVPHWYCSKKTDDYYTLWLRKSSLIPGAIDCFADNMR